MRRVLSFLVFLAIVGFGVFWVVTMPRTLSDDALSGLSGDAARGELVFWAGGCASCHAPEGATGDERLVLSGGQKFPSAFGSFLAPNISSDPDAGIGGWSALDLANAMTRGVSPEGQHYYPAFPYVSYRNVALQDVVDLKAFMDTLPASTTPSLPHEVGFPFNIRRSLGGWKLLFGGKDSWVMTEPPAEVGERGRYLVEALAHCAECHTPRNALGGLERDRWMAGAPVYGSATARFPNLTSAELDWSVEDIAYYLETGFTPEFDSAGGHMASVVENMAQLSADDRSRIAAYLKALPPAE